MEKIKTSWVIESKVHLAFKKECAGDPKLNMNSEVNEMIIDWLAARGVRSFE